jgi:hypothetical protein
MLGRRWTMGISQGMNRIGRRTMIRMAVIALVADVVQEFCVSRGGSRETDA